MADFFPHLRHDDRAANFSEEFPVSGKVASIKSTQERNERQRVAGYCSPKNPPREFPWFAVVFFAENLLKRFHRSMTWLFFTALIRVFGL